MVGLAIANPTIPINERTRQEFFMHPSNCLHLLCKFTLGNYTTWKVSAPEGALTFFFRSEAMSFVILKALRSNAFKITFQVV